jgi:hypothetical protein
MHFSTNFSTFSENYCQIVGIFIGKRNRGMHYFLKPLVRALRTLNDRELLLSIILGFLIVMASLSDGA